MGQIWFNGKNIKDADGNFVNQDSTYNDPEDPVLPAIRSFYHHGLFKITGNFEDKVLGLKVNQPIIGITDDGDEYYSINNARFNPGTASGASSIKIFNPFHPARTRNNERVTDCVFTSGTTAFGAHTPSYVRGCVGAANTDGIVSVLDFGAVGDGVTDDTAAIQRAINSNGGISSVYFPAGDYVVSSALIVTNPYFDLIGDGYSSRIINQTTDGSLDCLLKVGDGSFDVCYCCYIN